MPVSIKLFDDVVVWIQLSSYKVMGAILELTKAIHSSPFIAVEKWMVVVGHPPRSALIQANGFPLHASEEGIFRLIGDWMGKP